MALRDILEIVKGIRQAAGRGNVEGPRGVAGFRVWSETPGLEQLPFSDSSLRKARQNLQNIGMGKGLTRDILVTPEVSQHKSAIGGPAGGYAHRQQHFIAIRPDQTNGSALPIILAHEWAHTYWFSSLSKEAKAFWESIYENLQTRGKIAHKIDPKQAEEIAWSVFSLYFKRRKISLDKAIEKVQGKSDTSRDLSYILRDWGRGPGSKFENLTLSKDLTLYDEMNDKKDRNKTVTFPSGSTVRVMSSSAHSWGPGFLVWGGNDQGYVPDTEVFKLIESFPEDFRNAIYDFQSDMGSIYTDWKHIGVGFADGEFAKEFAKSQAYTEKGRDPEAEQDWESWFYHNIYPIFERVSEGNENWIKALTSQDNLAKYISTLEAPDTGMAHREFLAAKQYFPSIYSTANAQELWAESVTNIAMGRGNFLLNQIVARTISGEGKGKYKTVGYMMTDLLKRIGVEK
jgi:hypothetical protein